MVSSLPILLLVLVTAEQQPPATIVQQSSGWCSPDIANATGNVTVTCIGVDPRALQRLNAELNRKSLQLANRILEADAWTKRYKELEAQLSRAGSDGALSRQAEEYLHQGELEKAGAILDRILSSEEKQIDRTAANHYNRALVFELQFLPLDALPHLEKAYNYRSQELKYGEEYAYVLLIQKEFKRAEPVLLAILDYARQLANPDRRNLVGDLSNMANLYEQTQRLNEAEATYREALDIERRLAKTNPADYQPYVAGTLNNLANLYTHTQRMNEAEASYEEALDIYHQLAKASLAAYQPNIAGTLNNLAMLYQDTQRMKEAEAAYQEALRIRRQLAKANPIAYQPDVVQALNNLGVLYRETGQMKEAEAAYQEALGISRHLAKANPSVYQLDVAVALNNLAILYQNTKRRKEAETLLLQALDICRRLVMTNPATYQPYLATTLNNLAMLHILIGKLSQAEEESQEAVTINRNRWKTNEAVAADDLARSLIVFSLAQKDSSAMCRFAVEAANVAQSSNLKELANGRAAACPPR